MNGPLIMNHSASSLYVIYRSPLTTANKMTSNIKIQIINPVQNIIPYATIEKVVPNTASPNVNFS